MPNRKPVTPGPGRKGSRPTTPKDAAGKLRDVIGRPGAPKLPTPPMRKPKDTPVSINPPKKGAGPKRPAAKKKAAPGSAVRKKRGY